MTRAGGGVDMDQLVTRHHPPATACPVAQMASSRGKLYYKKYIIVLLLVLVVEVRISLLLATIYQLPPGIAQ